MKKRRKWVLVLVCLGVVIAGVLAQAFWPLSSIPLVVSRETTYFTGSLDSDGTVDYVAAYNQHFGAGVTPDENMAVPLIEALGPDRLWAEARNDVVARLGIVFPEDEQYLTMFEEHVETHRAEYEAMVPRSEPLSKEETARQQELERLAGGLLSPSTPLWDFISAEQTLAAKLPWRAEEHPIIAAWVEENRPVVDRLLRVPPRPRFFIPYGVSQTKPELPNTCPVSRRAIRELGYLLPYRVMLALGEGDSEGAWRDAISCSRLGRLCVGPGSGGCTQEGHHLSLYATNCVCEVALMGELTSEQAVRALEEYQALPRNRGRFEGLALLFRLEAMDFLMRMTRASSRQAKWNGKTGASALRLFDVNEVGRRVNEVFDEIDALGQEPDPLRRLDAAKALEAKHAALRDTLRANTELKSGASRVRFFFSSVWAKRRWATDAVLRMSLSLSLPATFDLVQRDIEMLVKDDLAMIALALAAYRADQGEYPSELPALSPKYLAEIPQDALSGADLHYASDGKTYRLWSVGRNRRDDGGYKDADLGLCLGERPA